MNYQPGSPFDSIESAYDFVKILSLVVAETKQDIDADIKRESALRLPRRLDALRVAFYSLEKLELHMNKSCRILNDLRSLRRLLFEERKIASTVAVKPKPSPVVKAEAPATEFSSTLPPPASQPVAVSDQAAA